MTDIDQKSSHEADLVVAAKVPESTSGSGTPDSKLESAAKLAPLLAVVLAFIYAIGLVSAWIIDANLGVGSVSVPHERAVSLGVFALILSVPILTLYSLMIQERTKLGDGNLKTRLSASFVVAIFPIVLCGGIVGLLSIFVERPSALAWFVYNLMAILGPLYMAVISKSNARRMVVMLPWFLFISVGAYISIIAPALPISFGGHSGPQLRIKMKDGKEVDGLLKTSDTSMIVIQIGPSTVGISRDQVSTISSVISQRASK